MKSLILLIISLIALIKLQSQTYRPFIHNDTVFYRFQSPMTLENFGSITTQNFIITANIDSQETIANSIYRYFYRTLQKEPNQKGLGVEINRKIFVDNGAPLLGCYPCEKLIYYNKNGERWGINVLTKHFVN